jgi:hypothetical protein
MKNNKNSVKLTENRLRGLIKESVRMALNEIGDTYDGQYMLGQYKADYEDGKRPYYSQIKDRGYDDCGINHPFTRGYNYRSAKNELDMDKKEDLDYIKDSNKKYKSPVSDDMVRWLDNVLDGEDLKTYRYVYVSGRNITRKNMSREECQDRLNKLIELFVRDGGSKYMVNGRDYSNEMLYAINKVF